MATLTIILFGFFTACFSYGIIVARTRRQMLALVLVAALVIALATPQPALAQASLVAVIESVLNIINGSIQSALNSIHAVRNTTDTFYQQAIWPAARITQEKALMTQMIGQYRNSMQRIFSTNLNSSTLPDSIALETVMRNHQTNDFTALATSFGNAYGVVPPTNGASPADRTMMDMDDALAIDNLKTLKESDAADDLTLQTANSIENQASQAAPGSAPFLTATAVAASIESQALTQKMLASELRQEAARLAHDNALRKRGATISGDISTQILNLLQRH
ncbi:MAG: hypothetical protein WBD87_05170 [Candidatus Acidiferrales bacterium]